MPICPNCKSKVNVGVNSNTFTDPRDGQVYKTVKIGNQVWLAENMRFKTPKSVDFGDEDEEPYGRFYTWAEAKKAVPKGWRLPSNEDFKTLVKFVSKFSGKDSEGTFLKSSAGWQDCDVILGTNATGFNLLPSGFISNNGEEKSRYGVAILWTSDVADEDKKCAYRWFARFDFGWLHQGFNTKTYKFPIRLIQEGEPALKTDDDSVKKSTAKKTTEKKIVKKTTKKTATKKAVTKSTRK